MVSPPLPVLFPPWCSLHFYAMEGTILRSEALRLADSGEPFDMVIVTADRRRGTGGDLITLKQWKKMDNEDVAKSMPSGVRKTSLAMTRSPNHWTNKTINAFNPNNRSVHPIKVHFRLIQFFNGKRVLNG